MAEQIDQQPGGIAAGTHAQLQRLLRRINPPLQPHDIGDPLLHHAVDLDQHVHRARRLAGEFRLHRPDQPGQSRAGRMHHPEGRQFLRQHRVIGEGKGLGLRFQEEIERVDGRHIGDEIHHHLEARHRLRKNHAGEKITLRVLLPVEEMRLGRDLQGIGDDGSARIRGRAQPDGLRAHRHRAVVFIAGAVGDGGVDGHEGSGRQVAPAWRMALSQRNSKKTESAADCQILRAVQACAAECADSEGRNAPGRKRRRGQRGGPRRR